MRTLLICLIICISGFMLRAQTAGFQDLIPVSTKSPDAASLGKFGDVPVSYNTGATSVSIPVFQINVGRISVPISLDYHTGGIRVDETSSSVGIGWALNGIGIVSRNVIGLPDEQSGGYLTSPPFDSLYLDWANAGGLYGSATDLAYSQFLYSFRNGIAETEPDIFSYSLAGGSGKFILKKDGSVFQIPKTNNIIQHDGSGLYKITDANGVVYVFDKVEHTETVSGGNESIYAGSWRLSKMIDPFIVDTVYFSYETACDASKEQYHNYTYSFGFGPDCTETDHHTGSATAINYQGLTSSVTTVWHQDELFPSQITWRNGKIVFNNTCDRLDNAGEKRLNQVDVYSTLKGHYTLVKSMKLYQSYFYSNISYTSTDPRNYRLKLDSVSQLSIGSADSSWIYRMTYHTGNMAGRESSAQDTWGFNNGATSNSTLMPAQTILYNSATYNIGDANRNVDSLSMLACMISSIQYPTGGKSVFEFEPHRYPTTQSYTESHSVSTTATGSVQSTSQISFTPDSNGQNFTMQYSFSSYNYSGVTDRPRMIITDQTAGTSTTISSNSDPNQSLSASSTWSPILGHTYLIVINIYTTTAASVHASVTISWADVFTNVPVNLAGGGLRVKSVTNYDNTGAFINKDIYKYGIAEDGLGTLLTSASYLLVNFANQNHKCGYSDNTSVTCEYFQGPNGAINYYANPTYPATQFSGSPVLYGAVTKYQVDAAGNASNGKSVFTYSIYEDQPAFASTDYGKVGVLLITDGWRNGLLGSQQDYKYDAGTSTYKLVHQKRNNYTPDMGETMSGLKLVNLFNWNTSSCYVNSMVDDHQNYLLVQIPYNSGAMVLSSTTDTLYDINGVKNGNTTSYTYSDTTHFFPTSNQTVDSKGLVKTQNLKYPHDLSVTGNIYASMLQRNIISPVVQQQTVYNGSQTDLKKIYFSDVKGNGTVIMPDSMSEQVAANSMETRIRFNKYDNYGNIVQQQKANDVLQSYIWDYQGMYPVAHCMNADSASIAYTGWEAEGTGNWTIPAGAGIDTPSTWLEGSRSFLLNAGYSISKTGLNSSITYIISYWTTRGSAFAISGTIGGYPIKGKTLSMGNAVWTLYVHKVTGVSTVSIGGGVGYIDCLRLYPANALMTTYTYAPLVGMTSQCDAGNRITYYEYDGLQRLKIIRDQDYNIVKTYEYQYGASSGCGPNCYAIAMQTFAGTTTLGYPVGVFDVHGRLLGKVTGASQYVTLWNSDTANARIGILSTGADSLHFNMTLNTGMTLPAGVTGCRYYQVDLAWSSLDGVRNFNGAYVDFGDSTGMRMGAGLTDTPAVIAANTIYAAVYEGYLNQTRLMIYYMHTYPDTSLKTLTFYHNDANEMADFDNIFGNGVSLTYLKNLRGNFPLNMPEIGGSCYQQASMTSLASIANWSSLHHVTNFRLNNGDLLHPCWHISYPQDFMAGNPGLSGIYTTWRPNATGYYDTTFRLSRLKSDWNTYFTQLSYIRIHDDHWNHEDLTALTKLNAFFLFAYTQDHLETSNSLWVTIPTSRIDSIINQIAAGAGQTVTGGTITIYSAGPDRSSASDTAVSFLTSKGWTITINTDTHPHF